MRAATIKRVVVGDWPKPVPEPSRLPHFGNPPVVELALAMTFDPLPGLGVVKLVRLWEQAFREDFPIIEEQLPTQMPIEPLDDSLSTSLLSFQLAEGPLQSRLWFLSSTRARLVQVQRDWLAVNWRKAGEETEYPRFQPMRELFDDTANRFGSFAEREELGPIIPRQVELTYVNHVRPEADKDIKVSDVLTLFDAAGNPPQLPSPDASRLAIDYPMMQSGQRIGRLHVTCEPALTKSDRSRIMVLTWTARGRPLADGFEGVIKFLDVAHDAATVAFEALVRPELKARWYAT